MATYNKLRRLLFEAGLSEAEVFVYIALIKKPAETIWDLVMRTRLPKTVVYRAFEELKEMKMVERSSESIRALSLKNFLSIIRTTSVLIRDVYVRKQPLG